MASKFNETIQRLTDQLSDLPPTARAAVFGIAAEALLPSYAHRPALRCLAALVWP